LNFITLVSANSPAMTYFKTSLQLFLNSTTATLLATCIFVQISWGNPPIGLDEYLKLDQLPCFRESVHVGSVSSYDRTEGNDDGFSGTYSFVRKEGDSLVLADLTGPGVIYRIWTPTPSDDVVEFTFDGEAEPRLRIPFRKLFDGSTPPFLSPLVDNASGGNWCYLPIPYAQSCKIVIRAPKMQFYQINYATYGKDTKLTTFSPAAPPYSGPALEAACDMLRRAGEDLSHWVAPPEAKPLPDKMTGQLAPGQTSKLFEAQHGGRIVGLRLAPASAFAGPDRAIVLRISWDREASPAVLCPVGDFFGFSWGQPSMRSLLVGTENDTCYAYFPMPYDESARIELQSERTDGRPIDFTAEVVHVDVPRRPNEGRFYTTWRRENPTTVGQPFTFVDVKGRGHLVGVTLQAEGEKNGYTGFFEGDDRATIDGELAIHGTGTEDFFNGGYYDVPGRWESRASYPLSGCLDYLRSQSRSGGYRLFIGDAYAFRRSLTVDIEHAATGNSLLTDYVGVSYFYLDELPDGGWALPVAPSRRVQDVRRLVFMPGWYQPSFTFSIENATISKSHEQIDGIEHRVLSLSASGADLISPHHLAFYCEVPAAGRYRVSLETILGPDQGVAQLFDGSRPAGPPLSMHAAKRSQSEPMRFGELKMQAGLNRVFFRVSGPDDAKSNFRFEVQTLVLEKLD
jgi:hypothetical protein